MSHIYFLEIRNEDSAEIEACAYGSAEEINFIGRRHVARLLNKGGSYGFWLAVVESYGQDPRGDEAVKVGHAVADADTVAGALKRRLSALKAVAAKQ